MKSRFKNANQNKAYFIYIQLSRDIVHKIGNAKTSKGNRDFAFRSGWVGWNGGQFPRNSLLYAIYVAGKEWKKINGDATCPDCDTGMKLTNEMNTDWYGNLKYYWCKSCETEFVSRRNGELEISVNNL